MSTFTAYDHLADAYVKFPTKTDALMATAALETGSLESEGGEADYSPALLFDAFVKACLKPTFNIKETTLRTHEDIVAHTPIVRSHSAHDSSFEYPSETDGYLADVLFSTKGLGSRIRSANGAVAKFMDALIEAALNPSFSSSEMKFKTYGEIFAHVSEERFEELKHLHSTVFAPHFSFPECIFAGVIDIFRSVAISALMDERESPSSYALLASDRQKSTAREIMSTGAAMRLVCTSWAAPATTLMGVAAMIHRNGAWDNCKALRSAANGTWTYHVELHGHWGNEAAFVCALVKRTEGIRTLDVTIGCMEHVDALVEAVCRHKYLVDVLVYFPLCDSFITNSEEVEYLVDRLSTSKGFRALQSIRLVSDGIVRGTGLNHYLVKLLRMKGILSVCFRSTGSQRTAERAFEEVVWKRTTSQQGEDEFTLNAVTLSRNQQVTDNLQQILADIQIVRLPVFYKGVRNVQKVLDACRLAKTIELHWCCIFAPDLQHKLPQGTLELVIDFDAYNAFVELGRKKAKALKAWFQDLLNFIISNRCPTSLQRLEVRCRWFAQNDGCLANMKAAFKELVSPFQQDVASLKGPKKNMTIVCEFLTDSEEDAYCGADMESEFVE